MPDVTTSNGRFSVLIGSLEILKFDTLIFINLAASLEHKSNLM